MIWGGRLRVPVAVAATSALKAMSRRAASLTRGVPASGLVDLDETT